jgi:hypothetical protein
MLTDGSKVIAGSNDRRSAGSQLRRQSVNIMGVSKDWTRRALLAALIGLERQFM